MASTSQITFAVPFETGIPCLARVVRSIVAQRDSGWTALVYDVGTEQGVGSVVRSFGDRRVRYVRGDVDENIGRSFNRCMELAESDLVTLFDVEGELLPNYCDVMREAASRHPEAAALFCRAAIMDERGNPLISVPDFIKDVLINPAFRTEVVLRGEAGVEALLKGNFIVAPTLCFRRSVLGDRRFREDLKIVLVRDFTTRLLLDGEMLAGVPQRCCRYRGHNQTASAKHAFTELWFKEELSYYDWMIEESERRGWARCVRLAEQRTIMKLNVLYRAVKNVAMLDLADVRRGLRLFRRQALAAGDKR